MNARQSPSTSPITFFASPQVNLISVFVAIVLGASLIEFNSLLFPPEVTSLSFWAILPVYYFALDAWFAIMTWGRHTPYSDKPLSRTWVSCTLLGWTSLLALMFFASRLPDSLLSYMWGLVVMFIFISLSYFFRYRDTRLPQPRGLAAKFGSLALVAATAYSIWALVFPPIPDAANWVFVFVVFGVLVSYRQLLRLRHAWQPEYDETRLRMDRTA